MTSRRQLLAFALVLVPSTGALIAADGDLDTSFSGNGKATLAWGGAAEAISVAPLDDGSLLVGGSAKPASTAPWDLAVAKYRADGTLDTGWGVEGKRSVTADSGGPTDELLLEIFANPSGSAVLLGTTVDPGSGNLVLPFLARLTAGGDLDPTFGDGGTAVADPFITVRTHSAVRHLSGYLFFGKCGACGPSLFGGLFLYRAGSLGHPDNQFGNEGWLYFECDSGNPEHPESMAVQPDGKIVVAWTQGGYFVVRRFLSDGTPDPDFGIDGRVIHHMGTSYSSPADLAIDPNGGAIYVGLREHWDPPLSGTIARLEPNGDLDTTFGFPDLNLEEGSDITTLAVTTDGKIVAAGRIDANGDQTGGFFLARLLPTGDFDDSFDGNGVKRVEFDLAANAVDGALGLSLSGGKPVVVGYATPAGTQPATSFAILRLGNTHIFGDGLESGSTWQWTRVVQPAP